MAFGRSVDEIILRITGDTSDAEQDIQTLATKLAIFSKESAEAEVNVLTGHATRDIDELRANLERLGASTSSPKVKADVGQALVELEVIKHELDSVDGRTANVDVDVQRGALERLNALSNSMFGLTKRFQQAGGESQNFVQDLSNFRVALGPLAGGLGEMAPLLGTLIPIVVALGAAVVALASSLGAAAAGAGALAIAFGGVLLPVIGLVVGGISRFKAESGTAGTAANALKTAFDGIKSAAKTLLPAVDPVFRAMAAGLNAMKPLIEAIGPVFKQFGQDAAGAVNLLVKQLSSPAIVGGITALIAQAGAALRPLASIAGSVFRIFLNIANAAMPFLTSALQGLAGGIKGFADSTGNIGNLRGIIGGLVSQLSSWLALLGSIAGVFLELGKIAAPFGQQLVDTFTKGTEGIRNFLQSAQGKNAVKQFFEDVLPLAQSLIPLIAQVALALIQIGQALAPALTPVVQVLTFIVTKVNEVLAVFNTLPTGVRSAIAGAIVIIAAFATGVGEIALVVAVVVGSIMILSAAFGVLRSAGSAVWGAITGAARSAAAALSGAFNGAINGIVSAFHSIVGAANAVWAAVRGIFGKSISFVITLPRNAIGLASSLWGAVKGILSKAISFVTNLPRTAIGLASSLWSAVSGILKKAISMVIHLPSPGSLGSIAASIWHAIDSALPDIEVHIHIPHPSIPVIGSPVKYYDSFSAAGKAMGEAIQRGLAATPVMPVIPAVNMAGLQSVGAGLIGGSPTTNNNSFVVSAPEGEYADPAALLAQIDLQLRARGGLAG